MVYDDRYYAIINYADCMTSRGKKDILKKYIMHFNVC